MTDLAGSPDLVLCTRVFRAPRDLVFRCLVEPEHLTRFWGPTGRSTPLSGIRVDPRPGGVPEAYRSPQARAGFATSLDRLDAHLGVLLTPSRTGTEHRDGHDVHDQIG